MKNLPYLSILFAIVLACNSPERSPVAVEKTDSLASLKTKAEPYIGTGKLIPINFTDTNYVEAIHYANDTITKDGWQIKYLVKDDSTRYEDIYIEWSKGSIKGVYKAEQAIEMRRYFIPVYVGEGKRALYFWHGCATDRQAILMLDKNNAVKAHDIEAIVDYNIPLEQFVYITDESYNKDAVLELAVIDMLRYEENIYKPIGIPPLNKQQAVTKVKFSKNTVWITTELRRSYEDTSYQTQTHPVMLNLHKP